MARIAKKKPVDYSKPIIASLVAVCFFLFICLLGSQKPVVDSIEPKVTIVCPSFPVPNRTMIDSYDDGTYRSTLYVETTKD